MAKNKRIIFNTAADIAKNGSAAVRDLNVATFNDFINIENSLNDVAVELDTFNDIYKEGSYIGEYNDKAVSFNISTPSSYTLPSLYKNGQPVKVRNLSTSTANLTVNTDGNSSIISDSGIDYTVLEPGEGLTYYAILNNLQWDIQS